MTSVSRRAISPTCTSYLTSKGRSLGVRLRRLRSHHPGPQDVEDIIRIHKLSLDLHKSVASRGNKFFDAVIVFAFTENNLPIPFKNDVDFITAFPCVS